MLDGFNYNGGWGFPGYPGLYVKRHHQSSAMANNKSHVFPEQAQSLVGE